MVIEKAAGYSMVAFYTLVQQDIAHAIIFLAYAGNEILPYIRSVPCHIDRAH